MRWYIIRTLLYKEALRNLANRGGIALALLLIAFAALLSFFRGSQSQAGGLIDGVQLCYIDYWKDGPWIRHLRSNVPPELRSQVRFRPVERIRTDARGVIVYPQNTGAIQIRSERPGKDQDERYWILFWHHGQDPSGLAPYEAWFWKESRRFFQQQVNTALDQLGSEASSSSQTLDPDTDPLWNWKESHRLFRSEVAARIKTVGPAASSVARLVPELEAERRKLDGSDVDFRSFIAMALMMIALYGACLYTMPSLTCEERERGILLAQALSPASPHEILAAKFIFYPAVGIALAALLGGIYKPAALAEPFFWLAIGVSALGFFCEGMTIASVARTQRGASMGALCFLLSVFLLLFICQQNRIPFLSYLALEFHGPRILQGALSTEVSREQWASLGGAAVLTAIWAGIAAYLFRRRGWQ